MPASTALAGAGPTASGLRSNRTRNLGVVFALGRPFEVELVEHIFPAVQELRYHLLLGAITPTRSQETVIDELLRYRCEGLIVVGPERDGHRLDELADAVAFVEVGRSVTRARPTWCTTTTRSAPGRPSST